MTTEEAHLLKAAFDNVSFVKALGEIMHEIRDQEVEHMRTQVRSGNLAEAARADAVATFCDDFFIAVGSRIDHATRPAPAGADTP